MKLSKLTAPVAVAVVVAVQVAVRVAKFMIEYKGPAAARKQLQDAPQTDSFEELEELAADRKKWNKFIREAFNTKHTHKPKIIQSTTKTSEAVNKPLPKALKGRKRVALKVVTNTITIRNPSVPPSPTNGGSLMEAPATVRRSRRLRLLQSGVT